MSTKNGTGAAFGGDLSALLKQDHAGPIKVYLDSGRRYTEEDEIPEEFEVGDLVQELYINNEGKEGWRNEKMEKPFLVGVYYNKYYRTPSYMEKMAQIEAEIKRQEAEGEVTKNPLYVVAYNLCNVVAKWDLKKDGKTIELTPEAILEAEIPDTIMYSILNACFEYNRVPKALSGRLQNTSAQKE